MSHGNLPLDAADPLQTSLTGGTQGMLFDEDLVSFDETV